MTGLVRDDTPFTQDYLKSCLDYDPATGDFTWLKRQDVARKWNSKHAGKPAGHIQSNGYVRIVINNRHYHGARLAWLFVTGKWPSALIDHENGDTRDNRFENLREATKSQNGFNRGRQANNTSGFKGVTRHRPNGKWMAQTEFRKRRIYIGLFENAEEAHAAYVATVTELHGEFVRAS